MPKKRKNFPGILFNFRKEKIIFFIQKLNPFRAFGLNPTIALFGFFVVCFLVFFPYNIFNQTSSILTYENFKSSDTIIASGQNILNNDPVQVKGEKILSDTGSVLGISEEAFPTLRSDNFQIKQINFGGNIILADENNAIPLKIEDVRTESVTDNKGTENKLLIYWRTNKLSISEVNYFMSGESQENGKRIKNNDYAFSHSLVLNNLQKGVAYNLIITAKDRWGNVYESGRFAAYSGKKPLSIFELIVRTLEDSFRWTKR